MIVRGLIIESQTKPCQNNNRVVIIMVCELTFTMSVFHIQCPEFNTKSSLEKRIVWRVSSITFRATVLFQSTSDSVYEWLSLRVTQSTSHSVNEPLSVRSTGTISVVNNVYVSKEIHLIINKHVNEGCFWTLWFLYWHFLY